MSNALTQNPIDFELIQDCLPIWHLPVLPKGHRVSALLSSKELIKKKVEQSEAVLLCFCMYCSQAGRRHK